jgi:hypothetical protein
MSTAAPSQPPNPSYASSDLTRVDWLAEYPPPRSLPLDQEALRIYEHAHALGVVVEQSETPPVTFSTVMAALLAGMDETSQWFTKLAKQFGPNEQSVFSEKGTDRLAVERLRPPAGKPANPKISKDKHLLTASSRSVLGIAEGWAQKVRGSEIGVRHLIAAYVVNPPPAHREQMQDKWKFQEAPWRKDFFDWVASRYTAEQWIDASVRPAPAQAIPEIERVEVKGKALAFRGNVNARAVLEHAAELHASRTDTWLRVQTLWHALIEKRNDPDVVASLSPIDEAVNKSQQQYARAVTEYFPSNASKRTVVAFDELDISPRVLNALETARELAVATRNQATNDVRVSVLHLAGALVSRRVDCDPELNSFGFDPTDLRTKLIQHAESLGESGDVWRDALGVEEMVEGGRPLDLNSDEPEAVVRGDKKWADDPLQIRRDVETFGSLLASNTLEPPLSIGLFGPWGSGKTTFLKRLRLAVERRAKEADDALKVGKQTPYVHHVVHVDFNAWHYAEGALTSSLVDTILRTLGDFITQKQREAGKEWERRKIEKLESTRRKVEAAEAMVTAAASAVSKAQTDLVTRQQEASDAERSLRSAAQRVWGATIESFKSSDEVKKSGLLEAFSGTVANAEELRVRIEALRNRPARMLRELGWPGTILFAALVLGVPIAVAWLSKTVLATHEVVQIIAVATGALSTIGVWLHAASAAVAKVDKAVDNVAKDFENRIASDKGVIKAHSALTSAQANAATAQAELQAARDELARARADAASATLPAQMLQLVTSRLDAQSYNKELTTTSLARADLEALSLLLRDQRSEPATAPTGANVASADATAAGEKKVSLKSVERVILYIDDLDRCKPQDVVRVLQLVHMLLAFELFVVVVAVDARWVEESLRHSYSWLSGNGAVTETAAETNAAGDSPDRPELLMSSRITPQDYLEKIFQIAFWLTPMTAQQAAQYLKSLVRAQARQSGPVIGSSLSDADAPGTASVEIEAIELDYMRYLAAYVGSSPRRVKRLVNAYRLIKASLTNAQLKTFITRFATDESDPVSGPYQLVIGLLVIGTGAPSSAARIFREIVMCDPSARPDELVKRFRDANLADWSMAAQVVEVVMRTQKATHIRELRNWASKVGRFLLNSPLDEQLRSVQASAP